jgi:protein ImuB
VSAPPAAVAVAGGEAVPVVAWAGPWPVETGWWDPARHRRRARFQVLTATGAAYAVALEGGRWWIEGRFS